MWQYRLAFNDVARAADRLFARYEAAVCEGEALAARASVRLFYIEGTNHHLLKDYRSPTPSA
jgi:hypothetical protein